MCLEQLLCDIKKSVTGCLGTSERPAVGKTLAGQHAFIRATQLLVHTEHITDLTCAGSDITGRYIHVCTDIFVQLRNEALAECHDLTV